MPSAFDRIAEIVGVKLAERIAQELGGRRMYIRKHVVTARARYEAEQFYLDGLPARKAAKLIHCDYQTFCDMKSRLPKNYIS